MTRIVIIASLLCNLSFAEADHTFTDPQGQSVTATVLDYNPSSRKILLEPIGRKAAWVNPDLFSLADQQYIQEWINNSYFLSVSSCEITVKEKTSNWGKESSRGWQTKDTAFSFIINNRNCEALKNLRVEYCLFWDRSVDGTTDVGSRIYKFDIGDITQDSNKEIHPAIHQGIKRKGFRKEVIGLSLRVYMENPEGKTLVREVRYPKNLSNEKYVWGDTEAEASISSEQKSDTEQTDKREDYYRIKFIVETDSWDVFIKPRPPWDKDWYVSKTKIIEPKRYQRQIHTKNLRITEQDRGNTFKKVEFTVYFKAQRARDLEFSIHCLGDSEVVVKAFNDSSNTCERIGTYSYDPLNGYITYKISAEDINKYGTVKFTPPSR